MANVSFSLTAASDLKVNNVATGTNAPGTGDVEVRVNMTNVTTRKETVKLLMEIMNYILYGSQTVLKP